MAEPLRASPEPLAEPAFVLRGVSLELAGARVLAGIDLEIRAGCITALVGASGSGKTSLLRLLNRLAEPTAGEIRHRGRPLAEFPVRGLRQRIGFVFQAPVLFPGSVRDNLRVAAQLAAQLSSDPGERRDPERAIEDALRAAELEPDLLDRPADQLSGGEAQRVTIARALVASPDVLLLDEPTSALDSDTAGRLVRTIRRATSERGLTVVMVTHRETLEAVDAVVVLERGRVARAHLPLENRATLREE